MCPQQGTTDWDQAVVDYPEFITPERAHHSYKGAKTVIAEDEWRMHPFPHDAERFLELSKGSFAVPSCTTSAIF